MKMKDFISSNEILLIIIGIFLLFPLFSNAQVAGAHVNSESIAQTLNNPSDSRIAGLHINMLKELYSRRGNRPIWINQQTQQISERTPVLRSMLLTAYRHGLPGIFVQQTNGDRNYVSYKYWTQAHEELYAGKVSYEPMYLELMASEALLKYTKHLLVGRFDPGQVDPNIEMNQREITPNSYGALAEALDAPLKEFRNRVDRFAPNNPAYMGLMALMSKLIKQQLHYGNFKTINLPKDSLKLKSPSMRDPMIPQLRERLAFYGYPTQNAQSDEFDADLQKALLQFQALNTLKEDGEIGNNVSKVLRYLNVPIQERMNQVSINMERLRWLPRNRSNREIYVNLAMTEFKLYEISAVAGGKWQYKEALKFRTVNGKGVRQSPIRIDSVKWVILNPDWTVPANLARQDKLPLLKQNPNWLNEHNMYLKKDGAQIPSETIDWLNFNPNDFQDESNAFQIVQRPGYDNALGVVKFKLAKGDAIYMHDTNERDLFAFENRHASSGCIRLEKPLNLADYLKPYMKSNPGDIRSKVPASVNATGDFKTKWIEMKYQIPVYLIYLTADQTPEGQARFGDDPYGQDPKLLAAMMDPANNQF
ncbi:L,D-transpeptidase family protein [Bdellovibrio sp. HCB185ZH]|uniref:L,D-transpeptidase family protein n=1 Tax=Bdellovibrio sp. HCB185ZH TaxID=3394235 RepID=UPI0039A586E3